MIIGTVENGRTGLADFPFYKGSAGIKDGSDGMELGYFGPIPTGLFPVCGTIDGIAVRANSYVARDAGGTKLTLGGGQIPRAVTLFVTLEIPTGED